VQDEQAVPITALLVLHRDAPGNPYDDFVRSIFEGNRYVTAKKIEHFLGIAASIIWRRLIDPGTRNQVLSLEMRIHQLDADQYGAGIELSKRFLTILHAAEESNRNSIATRNES
jgi:hypothetical protein